MSPFLLQRKSVSHRVSFANIPSMVVTRQYPPNYEASLASYNTPKGPIVTTANWPPGSTLSTGISGLMNCVFAYGGATVFNELMAEMRRPYVSSDQCLADADHK